LEIGLTPNRTDGMSHYGVARDLRAGLLHGTVEGIQASVGTLSAPATTPLPKGQGPFELSIESGDGCPSYLGLLIESVRVGPSPDAVQQRLKAIGVNPQNNVVDATNYVLHELGQPLHAFDADAIDGNTVVVRHPRAGEKLTTLDGEERTLHPDDQVIADATKPMCLAGVLGGETSGVSESTTRVFLESAYFNPVVTRKMAKRHGLSTDASFRFERGVDPEMVEIALARAAALIAEWAGGTATALHKATAGDLPEGQTVTLEWAQLNQLIGIPLDRDTVHAILKDLDIAVASDDGTAFVVRVPAYRHDVTRPADVVEEILRIYGFDKIPMPERLVSTAAHQAGVPAESFRLQTSNFLVSRGFQEMMNNSMTRASYTLDLGQEGEDGWDLSRQITLMNPLSSDLEVMRQSLLFQGLEAVVRNTNHQRPDLRLFELGKVYQHRQNADSTSENAAQRYEETERLALFMTGAAAPENWNNASGGIDAYAMKNEVYNLLASLGISPSVVKDSPLQSALISEGVELSCQGQVIGRMGKVRSSVARSHGVKQDVFWADLAVKPLTKISGRSRVKAKELAKFPSVRRDLSLILKEGTPFGTVRDAAMKAEKKLLKRVGLFDVYEGKNLEPGHVSYAVSLVLQDEEKTLNEKRIEQSVQRILDGIVEATGAQLRD
jgi:phenylalanyl-tRNA synthetase beta chain